jgi:RNA polymerase sigma-70 factor (ECF subfamily)
MYAEHAPALFRFLLYRTGDRVLSEDLLADTFEKVLRTRGGPRRKRGEERPWLYAIALNCLRDAARRGRVEQRALERVAAEPVPLHAEPAGGAEDHRERLERALASLADEEREAIGLRFGADLSVPEIARTLNLPLSTVEGRVYRGLRKLRERMS